jgi:methionyl-tRNA formyltransferase
MTATHKLRLAFFGTPEFAVPALRELKDAGHAILSVYTQPPRPAGRGQAERKSSVHLAAEAMKLPVEHPPSLKDPAAQRAFAALKLDAAVVVAYGLILPKPVLDAPRLGCVNIHASLLPRWRGAAPIQRAILAGDRETGVTIMRMDEGLDTGPMLLHRAIHLDPEETAGTLHDKLAALGAHLIVVALAGLAAGTLRPAPQPEQGATYADKIDKDEARLDWALDAGTLERRVRAFAPMPGAWFELGGDRVRVLQAATVYGMAHGNPGTVLDEKLTIACGKGALRPLVLQRAGKLAMPHDAFLRGHRVPAGTVLA